MAIDDKAVNLRDLKVSHDDLDGKVDDLKSDFNNKALTVRFTNLYNPSLNQAGRMYLVNVGSKQTTTTSPTQVFQKMKVEVGNSYALSGIAKASLTDENDIVVENLTVTNTNCIIQSVPSGVEYLWIETAASFSTTVTQVEKGTTITPYVPYGTASDVGYGETSLFDLSFPFDELKSAPSDIDTLDEEVNTLKSAVQVDGFFNDVTGFSGIQTFNGHIGLDGNPIDASSGWVRSDFIPTAEGAQVVASLKGYSTFPLVAYYDAQKAYMGSVSILSNQQRIVNINDSVPQGVAYAILVSQTNYDDKSFTIGTPANLSETIEIISNNLYPFKGLKVLCMGDSLTAGRDGLGNILSHNYPYYMQQTMLKGCLIDNKGVVGSTTVTYWNNNMSSLKLDDSIDIVLMMWGTNGQLVRNTLDTDVVPYDDYNDYADTGVGDFCKIIEYVMEHTSNNAQIILITPPYNGNSAINDRVINAQPVIKAIGERYNFPVIDMFKCGIGAFNYSKYMPDDSVHFSEVGYKWIGTYIGSCVNSLTAKRN